MAPVTPNGTRQSAHDEVEALHRRCGVYTRPQVVVRILDAVGWRADRDLSATRLLEPAAGDGVFVVEAAKRLIGSFARYDVEPTARMLADRIVAVELHRGEAQKARAQVAETLRVLGVHPRTAEACAKQWIVNSDFLTVDLGTDSFTHTVGNPPYVRWSKIPPGLKAKYAGRLPRDIVGGDLFLPFLHRALDALRPGGRCGFLCSDRWRFMMFAEGFRNRWLPRLDISSEDSLSAVDAFVKNVDSYPSVLIAIKRPAARRRVRADASVGKTLSELGYIIKVGPALGCTPAFVLDAKERDVEPTLLRPWVDGSEIAEGAIQWRGRRVVAMHAGDGMLVDPQRFPRLAARLARHNEVLRGRYVVRHGAPWYQPIDRVCAVDWKRPKLLIPELARVPRCAIDRSGAIPSHGVYAIFASDDDLDKLYDKLRDGRLSKALDGIAPRVKGGYVRCYRRFLSMIRIGRD